ncbi:MAG: DEAD/DEAH box helicase [Promethearchaeota archaeon]
MRFDIQIAQKSFLVIDKDFYHKKKYLFNIFVYRLVNDNREQSILEFNKQPIFQGMVEFGKVGMNTSITELEPIRFWKRIHPQNIKDLKNDIEKNLTILNPRLFIKLFKNVKFIAIPTEQDDESNIKPIYDLAIRYHLEDEIRRYLICYRCRKQRQFTIIPKNEYFISMNKKKICKDCAGKELYKILAEDYGITISTHLKILMARYLLKYRSMNKILEIFNPNFDPLKNQDMTFYDRKESSKKLVEKLEKIPKLGVENLEIPNKLKQYYKNKGIQHLLPIQTLAIQNNLLKNESMLVVSDTSSGKTLIGEIAGLSKILEEKYEKNPLPQAVFSLPPQQKKNAINAYYNALKRVRSKGKMLYLVPIVALASLRFVEYKELTSIGVVATLKVGKSYFEEEIDEEIQKAKSADIIIATYEAIDIILRSGGYRSLGKIATVVVDEIQMLSDSERGWILDGMIARLKFLYPYAQFIFLSATISEPKKLAEHYNCTLIEFKGRPVPLERHLIMTLGEFQKQKIIIQLCLNEFKKKSSYGYFGQTLIFTNSRKRAQSLSEKLNNNGVRAEAYHGGLTLQERKKIESLFKKQIISTIVTTAALAAGVDFPVSQVIFESLAMGIKWLTTAEFEQMCGRAGRYHMHDIAKVVILYEPGKTYHSGQLLTEEQVALNLLKGKIEPLEMEPNETRSYTELLAFISMMTKSNRSIDKNILYKNNDDSTKQNINTSNEFNGVIMKDLINFQNYLFNKDFYLKTAIRYLYFEGFIEKGSRRANGVVEMKATGFGKAVAESFFTIKQAQDIRESLIKGENLLEIELPQGSLVNESESEYLEENTKKSSYNINFDEDSKFGYLKNNFVVEMALEINPLRNIYVTNAVLNEIQGKSKKKGGSSLLFSNQILSILSANKFGANQKFSKFLKDLLLIWSREIFNCDCEIGSCNCPRKNIEFKIISLILEGYSIFEITKILEKQWKLKIYRGDLMDYIDSVIHNLKCIVKIGRTLKLKEDSLYYLDESNEILKDLLNK